MADLLNCRITKKLIIWFANKWTLTFTCYPPKSYRSFLYLSIFEKPASWKWCSFEKELRLELIIFPNSKWRTSTFKILPSAPNFMNSTFLHEIFRYSREEPQNLPKVLGSHTIFHHFHTKLWGVDFLKWHCYIYLGWVCKLCSVPEEIAVLVLHGESKVVITKRGPASHLPCISSEWNQGET